MIVITRSKIIDSTSYKLGRIEKENVSLFLRIIPGSSLNSFEIHFTILRSCCIFMVIKWKARCTLYILEFDISVKKHFVGGRCCWLEETAARPNHLLVFYSMYSTHCVFTLCVRPCSRPEGGGLPSTCPKRNRARASFTDSSVVCLENTPCKARRIENENNLGLMGRNLT